MPSHVRLHFSRVTVDSVVEESSPSVVHFTVPGSALPPLQAPVGPPHLAQELLVVWGCRLWKAEKRQSRWSLKAEQRLLCLSQSEAVEEGWMDVNGTNWCFYSGNNNNIFEPNGLFHIVCTGEDVPVLLCFLLCCRAVSLLTHPLSLPPAVFMFGKSSQKDAWAPESPGDRRQ